MDNLDLTHLGGHPHTGNDLMYMQNAIRNAFFGILNPLSVADTNDNIIWLVKPVITTPTLTTYEHTEGFVNFAGELFYIPSIVGSPKNLSTLPGAQYYLNLVFTNDPSGTVPYQSGTINSTWKNRRAEIAHGTNPWNGTFFNQPDLTEAIYKLLSSQGYTVTLGQLNTAIFPLITASTLATPWIPLVANATFNFAGVGAFEQGQWRIDEMGFLRFKGRINVIALGAATSILTLPAPIDFSQKFVLIPVANSTTNTVDMMQFNFSNTLQPLTTGRLSLDSVVINVT